MYVDIYMYTFKNVPYFSLGITVATLILCVVFTLSMLYTMPSQAAACNRNSRKVTHDSHIKMTAFAIEMHAIWGQKYSQLHIKLPAIANKIPAIAGKNAHNFRQSAITLRRFSPANCK